MEIHRRLGLANSIMGQLDGVCRKQQKLNLNTKLRLYSSLVLSVFLYGSKTWAMRKVDSEIQVFYMTSQRRILDIKWLEHVKNTAVSEKTGLNPLKPNFSNCNTLPYRPDLPFLISDIRALWCSALSTRVPECQKLNKRLCYCRGTARRATSVKTLWLFFD